VTQSGFVRVSSNRRAIPEARSPGEAREVLRRITALPGHVFWSDDIEIASCEHIAWERLGSHAQVTDAHLLALTIRRGGRLATFDRGLVDLAAEDKTESVIVLGGG
jgi:predicted nucleic acid-binding protein